jgi:hypothetical protein
MATAIQLYDLVLETASGKEVFQMRAPLGVIMQTLNLDNVHAYKRVLVETENEGICELHRNGHTWFVEAATAPLGTTAPEIVG